jgi:hypothetical protein
MRAINTIEQALAYPSERVRSAALQQISQMPIDAPKTRKLLQMATAYAPEMGYSNQRRVNYLCQCAEDSLAGDDDDSDEEEGTDWADAVGKGLEALFKGGAAVGAEAIKAEAQRQQQELALKIAQAKTTAEAAALQRQAALQQQAAQAKIAAAQAAASKAKATKSTITSGHFQRHWGKYLAGTTVTALLAALGVYLYKRQQTQAA